MDLYHIILLALIQGLTEFLPVSSSGHLGLYHCFTDQCDHWDKENLTLDIAVHVGTLFSVLLYFWRDAIKMLLGLKDIGTGKIRTPNAKLFLLVVIGSLPVIGAGFMLHILEPNGLKTMTVIAWTTLIFGILLWWVDAKYSVHKTFDEFTFKDAIIIGCAQMLALIPGTSRSGITMTAGRVCGFSRTDSARYALLLSFVAISAAGTLISISLMKETNVQLGFDALLAVILSFISGWLSIAVMMKFLERSTFAIFALYRIILGIGLLSLIYTGYIN